jgi:hypothetical protein
MMVPPRARLKYSSGWFAAGREVERAMTILPDASFRLFMWFCLHADRGSGSIRIEPGRVASALGRTENELTDALGTLVQKGVCTPPRAGLVLITDAFWPYERSEGVEADESSEQWQYIHDVKRLFLSRLCVKSAFCAADSKLAKQLYTKGVSIVEVEHAILRGTLRKCVALINNGRGTPITSLHYFSSLFDEVRQEISSEYWNYVARKVAALELRLAAADSLRKTK